MSPKLTLSAYLASSCFYILVHLISSHTGWQEICYYSYNNMLKLCLYLKKDIRIKARTKRIKIGFRSQLKANVFLYLPISSENGFEESS